jgi:hypothetical protein
MPNLKHNQTQFLTQASSGGLLFTFIVASFRVWDVTSEPFQVKQRPLVAARDAVAVMGASDTICFVTDGGPAFPAVATRLYCVDVSDVSDPVILNAGGYLIPL